MYFRLTLLCVLLAYWFLYKRAKNCRGLRQKYNKNQKFLFLDIKQELNYIDSKFWLSSYIQVQYHPMLMVWFSKCEDKAVTFLSKSFWCIYIHWQHCVLLPQKVKSSSLIETCKLWKCIAMDSLLLIHAIASSYIFVSTLHEKIISMKIRH